MGTGTSVLDLKLSNFTSRKEFLDSVNLEHNILSTILDM